MAADLVAEGCTQFQLTSLMKAAVHGDVRAVRETLGSTSANLDAVDAQGRTALIIAARGGHEGVIRELLAAGADCEPVDSDGHTAATVAADAGHDAAARLITSEVTRRAALRDAVLSRAGGSSSTAGSIAALLAKAGGSSSGPAESPF